MTNLLLSQMEQVTNGKVAGNLWRQIEFEVRCRQTQNDEKAFGGGIKREVRPSTFSSSALLKDLCPSAEELNHF